MRVLEPPAEWILIWPYEVLSMCNTRSRTSRRVSRREEVNDGIDPNERLANPSQRGYPGPQIKSSSHIPKRDTGGLAWLWQFVRSFPQICLHSLAPGITHKVVGTLILAQGFNILGITGKSCDVCPIRPVAQWVRTIARQARCLGFDSPAGRR